MILNLEPAKGICVNFMQNIETNLGICVNFLENNETNLLEVKARYRHIIVCGTWLISVIQCSKFPSNLPLEDRIRNPIKHLGHTYVQYVISRRERSKSRKDGFTLQPPKREQIRLPMSVTRPGQRKRETTGCPRKRLGLGVGPECRRHYISLEASRNTDSPAGVSWMGRPNYRLFFSSFVFLG